MGVYAPGDVVLVAPHSVGGFGSTGKGVIPLEHHADIKLRVLSFDGQHLPAILWGEEALHLKDHVIRKK